MNKECSKAMLKDSQVNDLILRDLRYTNHLALICDSQDTAHKVVDNNLSSLLSILTEDTAKQTTLAKKHFLKSVPTSPKKGR